MSYHGFLPLAKEFIHGLSHPPVVLEVGVDRGVSFITLATFMARTCPVFTLVGIDVLVQESVCLTIGHLDRDPDKQRVHLVEENSLVMLPDLIMKDVRFDLVLLDGDHNYHTVAEELRYLSSLTADKAMIIVDDYDGRWSERDLWYAERPGYEHVKAVSQKVATDKHGVKPAVDDWLVGHPEWKLSKPIQGEPVMLLKGGTRDVQRQGP